MLELAPAGRVDEGAFAVEQPIRTVFFFLAWWLLFCIIFFIGKSHSVRLRLRLILVVGFGFVVLVVVVDARVVVVVEIFGIGGRYSYNVGCLLLSVLNAIKVSFSASQPPAISQEHPSSTDSRT